MYVLPRATGGIKMKKYFYLPIFVLLLASAQAKAVDDGNDYHYDPNSNIIFGGTSKKEIYSLDNFVESEKSSSANIDIIRRDDIKKQNTPSLTDILNQVGSVTAQNGNGSDGSTSSIRIRGTDRVRMIIDGVRADRPSLTSASVEPQFILLDDIELIEVIKGPQGNVSGTNASGGLIAMQTRQGRGPMKIEIGSDMGNYGTFRERFAIMGGNEKADYYLSTTWYKTDGGMRTDKLGGIDNDAYNNLSAVSNLGLRLLDGKAEIRDVFRFSRARKNLGIGYNSVYPYDVYQDPNNYSKNIDIMNSLIFKHAPNEKYNYDVKFGLYHNKYDYYGLADDKDPYYTSRSNLSSTRLNAMTQHNFKITSWDTLSLGYNFETEFMNGSDEGASTYYNPMFWAYPYNDKSDYSGNTIQNDVYINDVINIKDKLFLRGGARLVQNSQYGMYISPNASAALILPTFKIKDATTKFRGSWGQSVNTPTLYQRYGTLYYMGGLSMTGNPDLEAEKYQSWDVGIEQRFFNDKLKFEFGYFNSNYRDYIAYMSDPYTWIGKYKNIDSAKIFGYEGKAVWEPNDKFKLVLNYTYTDSKDEATGYDLPATPRNRFNGTVFLTPFERWNLYFGVEAASRRNVNPATDESVPGYLDAKIGTSVRLFSYKGANVFLKADIFNLFNQNICMYKDASLGRYSGPKIRFRTGLFLEYNLEKKDNHKEKV